jgi:hypothetical protein
MAGELNQRQPFAWTKAADVVGDKIRRSSAAIA